MGMLLIYAHFFRNTTRQSEKAVMHFGLPLSVSFHQCPMPIHSLVTDAAKSWHINSIELIYSVHDSSLPSSMFSVPRNILSSFISDRIV